MLTEDLDVTYAIVWMLALANVLGTILCISLSNPIAQLTNIRFVLIAPFVFMIVAFAAFQSGQNLLDLGADGNWADRHSPERFDWSRQHFSSDLFWLSPSSSTQITPIRSPHFVWTRDSCGTRLSA